MRDLNCDLGEAAELARCTLGDAFAAPAAPSAHAAAGAEAVAERSVVDRRGPALIGPRRAIRGTGRRLRYVAALLFHRRRGGWIRGLSFFFGAASVAAVPVTIRAAAVARTINECMLVLLRSKCPRHGRYDCRGIVTSESAGVPQHPRDRAGEAGRVGVRAGNNARRQREHETTAQALLPALRISAGEG